jgi:hypothetical protein
MWGNALYRVRVRKPWGLPMARKLFEWSALLTWGMILGSVLMYGTLSYVFHVIDNEQELRMERIPDRSPSRTSIG